MKRKTTRRALVMSLLSLLLCCSMLVGTTFAWFTDSVTSGRNKIVAGNLDVVLEYWNGTEYAEVDGNTKLFNDAALWEPGHTEVAYLKVSNAGTLALKYQLSVNAYEETLGKTKTGETIKLSDHLVFSVVDKEITKAEDMFTREQARQAAGTTYGLKSYNSGTLPLDAKGGANDADYVALIIYMPEEVGNEANHDGVNVPSILIGTELHATQQTAESDSFNNQYDKDAWMDAFHVSSIEELMLALETVEDGGLIVFANDIENADGVLINGKNITIDLNGKTFTVSEGASTNNRNFKINGNSNVTIKNGTMVAAGELNSGAYGTIRTEGSAKVTLDNVKLYNYRGNGLNIKACSGTTVIVNNSEIYSQYGGGVEAAGGTVELNGVKVEQKGMWTAPYNSMAISVNGGGKATVNSGTYTTECLTAEEANNQGTSHGPWTIGVLNSGGTLIVNGGTFSNDNFGDNSLATYARGLVLADASAVIKINGGEFNAMKAIIDVTNNLGDTSKNPSATLSGGTFSADPRVSGLYASHLITVADGFVVAENADGTWTVDRNYNVVTPGSDKDANGQALAEAISTTTTPYIQLGAGEYKMPSIEGNKEVTIVGTKDTVIDNTMGSYMDSAKVSFEGVTIKGSTGKANGNGSDYAALYTPNVTYTNCTFDGPFRIGRDGATFIGCTFTNLGNDYVWAYGNDCTFIDCTFNSDGKALLLYSDGGNEVSKVTVKNCTFNATQGAKAGAIANQNCAAIEIQNYGNGVNLTVEGNTIDTEFSGLWRIKTYHAGRAAIIVNGVEYQSIAVDGKAMTIDASNNVTVTG